MRDWRDWQMPLNNPVLVTGATGHLGSHLVAMLLEHDRPVIALSRGGSESN